MKTGLDFAENALLPKWDKYKYVSHIYFMKGGIYMAIFYFNKQMFLHTNYIPLF